jgi:hypothetical protein
MAAATEAPHIIPIPSIVWEAWWEWYFVAYRRKMNRIRAYASYNRKKTNPGEV